MLEFPKTFLWGAATSSYQVEGRNANADWWEWEQRVGKTPSALACDHYQCYEQDFDLASQLHHNAHRMSVEWSRIEPSEGKFSKDELKHYVDVVKALRSRHLMPMVTLHHFTNPLWLVHDGGWLNPQAVSRFLKFGEAVVRALAPYVHYWITINEPTIYVSQSFLFGNWPPQHKSFAKSRKVHDHLAKAHIACYRMIHRVYKELSLTRPMVSLAHHMPAVVPCDNSLKNKLAVYLRDRIYTFNALDQYKRLGVLDYIGVNYYSRQRVDLKGWGIGNFVWDVCQNDHDPVKKNSLGWDIYPKGLYHILMQLKRYKLPIVITENGICTGDDNLRWEFIDGHLRAIHRAIQDGADVTGYFYWSLLDNFEWAEGFTPRFGLIDMDYNTQKRTVRASARKYGQVCQTGRLEG